jgi:deoxyuridine 5'-triphosphate nucleotidohydrolase
MDLIIGLIIGAFLGGVIYELFIDYLNKVHLAKNKLFCNWKKMSPNATIPTKGTPNSAGYDLYCSEEVTIPAWKRSLVKIDISYDVSPNMWGLIKSRSSIAYKKSVDVKAGVIDGDYRGLIGVVMANESDEDVTFNIGDRIAQMIFIEGMHVNCNEVIELTETIRGEGGFGSTGKGKED